LRSFGTFYDPNHYEASEALLRDLEAYDIEKLDKPDPEP
jgi:hypothetical protein